MRTQKMELGARVQAAEDARRQAAEQLSDMSTKHQRIIAKQVCLSIRRHAHGAQSFNPCIIKDWLINNFSKPLYCIVLLINDKNSLIANFCKKKLTTKLIVNFNYKLTVTITKSACLR